MGKRRLIFRYLAVERRQRLAAERQRGAIMQRPAAECQQRARGVVPGHQRSGRAQLVLAQGRGERALGGDRPDLLADPAIDRRRRDGILHVPVGAFMLEADRRPHQAGAGGESELVRPHRAKAQIGLAEAGLGALAALERADDGRRQRTSELRLPDEVDVAELRAQPEIAAAAAAGAQLAEAAVDPALLAVGGDQAHVTGQLQRVGGEKVNIGLRPAPALAHSKASAHATGAALHWSRRLPTSAMATSVKRMRLKYWPLTFAGRTAPRSGHGALVGERGFEPPAPASRRQCSTRLSYSPTGTRGCDLEVAAGAKAAAR